MSKILVTGANGFVGTALCRTLRARAVPLHEAARRGGAGRFAIGQLNGSTDWKAALAGCSVVVHLAARVHVMSDGDKDPMRAYREVNVAGSLNLARQAVAAGVKRFVFVSSVKVNGEASAPGRPFTASDEPAPCDPYGQSKLEAEVALLELGRQTGLEVVIVRPPLVYGPGVKANFLKLIELVRKGFPLPLGSVRNSRSIVALDNLVDLLIVCSTHPRAPGNVFMASDGIDVTIGELVRMIGKALGKPVRLVPVPVGLMSAVARLIGKAAVAERLFGSLQVDIAKTRSTLEWCPVVLPQAAINETVAAFVKLDK